MPQNKRKDIQKMKKLTVKAVCLLASAAMLTACAQNGKTQPDTEAVKPADFQKLLEMTKGTDEAAVVQTIALRSMQQARYSTTNAGHFGLASECYTHFTSPIRRYPDLMVHRLIRQYQRRSCLSSHRPTATSSTAAMQNAWIDGVRLGAAQ